MKKGEQSKARLVSAAASLLQRQGYHATGLAQVVEESGAPRGSLYFHFPGGKEELACAALEAAGQAWRERLIAVADRAKDPSAAVADVCRVLAEDLEASKYEHGCPLATVALEASTSSEAVRRSIADHYDRWTALIVERLGRDGIDREAGRRMAMFTLAAIEGALLLSKVQKSAAPLIEMGEALQALMKMASFGAGARAEKPPARAAHDGAVRAAARKRS